LKKIVYNKTTIMAREQKDACCVIGPLDDDLSECLGPALDLVRDSSDIGPLDGAEYKDGCAECRRVKYIIDAMVDVDQVWSELEDRCMIQDYGWGDEGETFSIKKSTDTHVTVEFTTQIGTCNMCDEYDYEEDSWVIPKDQICAIIAHRLDLSHAIAGRYYNIDDPRAHQTRPPTIVRQYDVIANLTMMLRDKLLGVDLPDTEYLDTPAIPGLNC
jgi:hypothetical protein